MKNANFVKILVFFYQKKQQLMISLNKLPFIKLFLFIGDTVLHQKCKNGTRKIVVSFGNEKLKSIL